MASFLSKQFGTVPVNTRTLKSALKECKAPMAKISLLQREGVILNLRRDLYLCLPEDGEGTYSRELVANHLLARGLFPDWPDTSKDGRGVFLPDRYCRKSLVRSDRIFIQSSHSVDEDHAVLSGRIPEGRLGHDFRDESLDYPGMC